MNHKWTKSSQKISDIDKMNCVVAYDVCVVCGCHRTTQRFYNAYYNRPELSYLYYRNGMHYDDYIDCIDIEKENQYEIDPDEINEIMGLK